MEIDSAQFGLALFFAQLIFDHRFQEAIEAAHHLGRDGSHDVGDRIDLPGSVPIQRKHGAPNKRSKND